MRPRGTPDIDLPFAALDGDRADILDQRLGAVSRTAGGRKLQLAGAVNTSKPLLDFTGQRHAVAEPKATVINNEARAGLLAASSRPSVRASKTLDTDFSCRSRIALIKSGLVRGMQGT